MIFTPIWGNTPILTNIFQMGWNHQPVVVSFRKHSQPLHSARVHQRVGWSGLRGNLWLSAPRASKGGKTLQLHNDGTGNFSCFFRKKTGGAWKNTGKYHNFRELDLLVLGTSSWWKLTATCFPGGNKTHVTDVDSRSFLDLRVSKYLHGFCKGCQFTIP